MSKFDDLLGLDREPEPADDGFTERVLAALRHNGRLRPAPWRRFVTRPAVLAAAAVLVAGGALAAVRTVAPTLLLTEPAPTPAPTEPPAAALPKQTPARPVAVLAGEEGEPPQQKTDPSPTPGPIRKGSAEYGYTSPHTAYANDRGLRLEAETYDNEMRVGEPERVTVSLENLTDQPITLYAPRGCVLTVGAAHQDNEGRVWRCAGSGGDPRTMQNDKREPEMFVLEPHARRVEDALIVLDRPGQWIVSSQCLCYERTKQSPGTPSPTPKPTPPPGAEGLARPDPTDDAPDKQEPDRTSADGWTYGSRNLFTPPIRIQAQ